MFQPSAFLPLGESFYELRSPRKCPNPKLLLWNKALAEALGLDPKMDEGDIARIFSGSNLPEGTTSLSLAYAGHQFGNFVPQLGDGRAHLLGELESQATKRRYDVQLKGSGISRFSRGGDGLCGLGPAIREYIMSEAMWALGVPTTRALAVVTTGEHVMRREAQPGAVVTRVAASHIRVGSLQYFAAQGDYHSVKTLCDLAIEKHFSKSDSEHLNKPFSEAGSERYLDLFMRVMSKQLELIVQWMRVGFIHGVMNTDNTLLSGETIDYGPCAMLGVYNPNTVFSSIDSHGRYAFGNQASIAQWNMVRLAECLLPIIDEDVDAAVEQLRPLLMDFSNRFEEKYRLMMANKLGFEATDQPINALTDELLKLMEAHRFDYTNTFDALSEALNSDAPSQMFASILGGVLEPWGQAWEALIKEKTDFYAAYSLSRKNNPRVIPRNHHVEDVIRRSIASESAEPTEAFLEVLRTPYSLACGASKFQDADPDYDGRYQTFCGT